MAERAIASTNFPIFLNVTKLAKILDVVRGNETWLKFGYRTIRQFPFSHIYTHTHTNFHLSCITFFSAERTTGNERGKGRKEERGKTVDSAFFFLFCYKTGQKALFLRPFVQLLSKPICPRALPLRILSTCARPFECARKRIILRSYP